MAHPAHKIAGPMLRTFDPKTGKRVKPATPEEVSHALSWPQAAVPKVVHDEWVNAARRVNGLPGTSELAGTKFRTNQDLRRRDKRYLTKAPAARLSKLQRIARRIARLFRK